MDNLTHTLAGLALSRTGFNRWCAYATPAIVLGANAADIDILSLAGGQTAYLHYHRHFTHALLFIPVLALLPVLLVRIFARKPIEWKKVYLLSCLGALTHPLLDWTNTYGVRALMPFSDAWLRLDINNVFDFWIWAILLLAALGPALSRLVSSEMGARPSSGRGLAVFALLLLCGYEYGRYLTHQRAVSMLDARLYEGAAPVRTAALPGPGNPLAWRGLVETFGAYRLYDISVLRNFDPGQGEVFYKPEFTPREQQARIAAARTPAFQTFLAFSQYPFWRVVPEGQDGLKVEAFDLRFGTPERPRFQAAAVLGPSLDVRRSWFSY